MRQIKQIEHQRQCPFRGQILCGIEAQTDHQAVLDVMGVIPGQGIGREPRLKFLYSTSIELGIVEQLNLPDDIRDAWWADSMVVVKATK
jgi:hypothetical protein